MPFSDSFYADQNFLNTTYAMDISLETHLSGLVFPDEIDPTNRVIYASNGYAFRQRSKLEHQKGNDTNLDLPFINYELTDFEFGQQTWWNNELYSRGVFIDEVGTKVRISPVQLVYEATFWCHREDELRYAYTELRFDADSKTTIESSIGIDGVAIPFVGQLGYTNLKYDPEYKEDDWLERNNIHSIALDFEVVTFMMKADADFTLTETVILEFNTLHGIDNTEVALGSTQAIVDHFNQEVGDFCSSVI